MLVVHLLCGVMFGAAAAAWSWTLGSSFLTVIGLYMLAGQIGVVASATVAMIGVRRSDPLGRTPAEMHELTY
jgi:NADH:ubiquinone oxidoreductase subunit 6 (subunit J)